MARVAVVAIAVVIACRVREGNKVIREGYKGGSEGSAGREGDEGGGERGGKGQGILCIYCVCSEYCRSVGSLF